MTACSWQAGWRSLLLRAYTDPEQVEEFTIPATADPLIVLVTSGSCDIEARYGGGWHAARYRTGSIGLTAPEQEVTLRWRSKTQHRTLQLHLPAATIHSAYAELFDRESLVMAMPCKLFAEDPLISSAMLSLASAMAEGVSDLYAETAAHMLIAHLMLRHSNIAIPLGPKREDQRLRRVDDFMRANLASDISLAAMAKEACLSRFHLVRLFKRAHGETPFKRLARLRIEEGQRRLRAGDELVTEIAFACGYENPAHFASAFRRLVGVSPSDYRRAHQ